MIVDLPDPDALYRAVSTIESRRRLGDSPDDTDTLSRLDLEGDALEDRSERSLGVREVDILKDDVTVDGESHSTLRLGCIDAELQ